MTFRVSTALAVLPVCVSVLTPAMTLAATPEDHKPSRNEPLQVAALDPVVVTPTRTSRTADASLSSVTVIDEEQLRHQDPVELRDALQSQPGVDMTGNGAFGKTTSMFLRGTGSSSTLLMVDGVRLRSATAGSPSWQFLPPRLIDRVEIVRGPRGSLYGADAVGGVVQVFTPDGSDPGTWLEMGAGSFNSRRFSAGTEGERDGTRYALGIDRFDTDGTEIREGSEDRGYDNTAGHMRVTHRFDNNAEVGVFGFRASGTTEFEGSTPEQEKSTDYAIQVAGVNGQLWLGDNWLSKVQISDARDQNESFTDGDRDSIFDTRSRAAQWQNVIVTDNMEFVLGGDFRRDSIESTTQYEETERDNAGGFAQLLLGFGALDVQASGRYDDNEAYGHKTTGAVALGYKLGLHHRLRASYGTAFRAPTFNDLYYPGFGNPDLDPESSETTELGVRGQFQHWFWDLAVYQTDVEDLIDTKQVGGNYLAFNVNEARIRGAELSGGLELDQWRLAAAFTAQDPEDRQTDNVLQRRAQRSARLDLDRRLGDLSLGGSLVVSGHRYDDAENENRLAGYGLLDLRAGWRFAPRWSGRVVVRNVLDKEYATTRNFSGWEYLNAGRSVMASLRYDID